jgi:hypothetical protein
MIHNFNQGTHCGEFRTNREEMVARDRLNATKLSVLVTFERFDLLRAAQSTVKSLLAI